MTEIELRPATDADCEQIWRWRNDPTTRQASLAQGQIPFGAHKGWFDAAIQDPDRAFRIGQVQGQDIGVVRLDRDGDSAVVSITIDSAMRGKKLAKPFLLASLAAAPWPVRRFTAVVRQENQASLALFRACGFDVKSTGNPVRFEKANLSNPLIIVLANEFDAIGTPNDQSAARLDVAKTLLDAHPDARLVTSGWPYARDPETPISSLMARAAVKAGVAKDRIIESPRARDTVGDAVFLVADIIQTDPPPSEVTVVTSAYHAKRAQTVFDFVLSDIAPVRVVATDEPASPDQINAEDRSIRAFGSTFEGIAAGDIDAILARVFANHPLYNGEIAGPDSPGVVR